jgi:hypothetical protein
MALRDSAAWRAAEGGDELAGMLLRLRLRAVCYLDELAGSARQVIAAGEPPAVDSGRVPGPDHLRHPGLAGPPRQRPQGGGRTGLNRCLGGA